MVLILSTIAVIVYLSQKLGRINDSGSTAFVALTEFYPFWTIWIVNTFLPIAVFITVIYFTSRLTMQTEIVGILSGGISFYRFTLPYLWVAIFLAVSAMLVGNIVLPWAASLSSNPNSPTAHDPPMPTVPSAGIKVRICSTASCLV